MTTNDGLTFISKFIPNWALPFSSILVCAVSSIVMTAAAVVVKQIDNHYSGGIFLVVIARFIVMFVMCTPILCYK